VLIVFALALTRRGDWVDSGVLRGLKAAAVNAGVVVILLAALYDPVWTSAIGSHADFGPALAAFGLLVYARWPPLLVVALAAGGPASLRLTKNRYQALVAVSHFSTLSRPGTPPACTTLPSITTPGVLITP